MGAVGDPNSPVVWAWAEPPSTNSSMPNRSIDEELRRAVLRLVCAESNVAHAAAADHFRRPATGQITNTLRQRPIHCDLRADDGALGVRQRHARPKRVFQKRAPPYARRRSKARIQQGKRRKVMCQQSGCTRTRDRESSGTRRIQKPGSAVCRSPLERFQDAPVRRARARPSASLNRMLLWYRQS